MGAPIWSEVMRVRSLVPRPRYHGKLLSVARSCSTLGAGALVLSPPNGGGGAAAFRTAATKLALLLPDATRPLPAPSSGASNVFSSPEVQGFLPGVSQ